MATQVLTQHPVSPHKPLPLRRKVSYAKPMTVCIAAACDGQKPGIVLCSDSRLDYGELGSTNMATKLAVLGYGWCVQMAGDDWGGVKHWKENLKRKLRTPKKANLEQVGDCLRQSADYFMKSVFCERGKAYQLLLSGFPCGSPVIISANLYPTDAGHSLSTSLTDSFNSIGSGSPVALAILSTRECHRMMPLEYVLYLVYEAKRTSEKTGGVGVRTVMALHLPGHEETADRAAVVLISNSGIKILKGYYDESWKVPFRTFPKLDSDFYFVPEDLQGLALPKADPQPQQPSPGSSAKSDEP